MGVKIRKLFPDDDCSDAVMVPVPKGSRFGVALKVDGGLSAKHLALVEALDGEEWLGQVRRTADAEEVVDEFTFTADRDEDDVLRVVGVIEDTTGWSGDYVFDFKVVSGSLAPSTFLVGSLIHVVPAVSREVGS